MSNYNSDDSDDNDDSDDKEYNDFNGLQPEEYGLRMKPYQFEIDQKERQFLKP